MSETEDRSGKITGPVLLAQSEELWETTERTLERREQEEPEDLAETEREEEEEIRETGTADRKSVV